MNAIFFKDNIYVLVKDKEFRDKGSIIKEKTLIGCYGTDVNSKRLYGGRVFVDFGDNFVYFEIDGIRIKLFKTYNYPSNKSYKYTYWDSYDKISLETCTAFLNQIESLGVDTFLENYKNDLLVLKQEQEKRVEQLTIEMGTMDSTADNYSQIHYVINQLKLFIQNLGCLVLILSIHMNAGLDNHIYTDTYNSIINQFFQ